MAIQIIIVIVLTFVIHLISTLSYSVRIVGTRTRKIAISFALFNIMVLISRTSNSFQAPLLAKWIEENINLGIHPGTLEMRLIILSTSIATLLGGFLIPTFQRILSKAVMNFSIHKSVPKLLLFSFTQSGIRQIKQEIKIPDKGNFQLLSHNINKFPIKIFIYNSVAVSILTVGVLSSLYAGFLTPELRTTASTLSSIVNGFATILLFVFIDPYLSILTDEVIEEKYSETDFRKTIRFMVFSRFIGTLLAQFLLIPFARLIAEIARFL